MGRKTNPAASRNYIGYPVTIQRDDRRLVTIYYVVYGERDTEGTKGIAPLNAFTESRHLDGARGMVSRRHRDAAVPRQIRGGAIARAADARAGTTGSAG